MFGGSPKRQNTNMCEKLVLAVRLSMTMYREDAALSRQPLECANQMTLSGCELRRLINHCASVYRESDVTTPCPRVVLLEVIHVSTISPCLAQSKGNWTAPIDLELFSRTIGFLYLLNSLNVQERLTLPFSQINWKKVTEPAPWEMHPSTDSTLFSISYKHLLAYL